MDFDYSADKSNMGLTLSKFSQQCRDALSLGKKIKIETKVKNIVVVGMGGSGIACSLLKDYLGNKVPIHVVQDYTLPEFVDAQSLVFCVSYSGNTTETVSCFRSTIRRNVQVVAITTGGKLKELAKRFEKNLIELPGGIPPRTALGYLFIPMLTVLQNSGIITDRTDEIKNMIDSLMNVKFKENAQELAKKLQFKIPIIYSSNRLKAVALRWKQQFNENSKVHCFSNVIPEIDHNEIVGYENLMGDYFVIILKDEKDNMNVKEKMSVVKKIISDKCPVMELVVKGDCLLTKMFSAIYLGDLTSFYLALLYGVDPAVTESIDEIKKH